MSDEHKPLDFDGAPLPVLLDLLRNGSVEERSDAACALGDRLRTREIPGFDDEVVLALRDLLVHPVMIVRFEAAIALAEAKDAMALDVLLAASAERRFRLDAIRALGALGDARAVPTLHAFLRRFLMPWADKLQAAAALCAIGDPVGAAYVESKLSSKKHPERAAAIHFIGESRHPRARSILETILADANHPMRDVAARALGLLGDPASVPALSAALAGADAELQGDIAASLARLQKA